MQHGLRKIPWADGKDSWGWLGFPSVGAGAARGALSPPKTHQAISSSLEAVAEPPAEQHLLKMSWPTLLLLPLFCFLSPLCSPGY